MSPFVPKDWKDWPDTTTPLTAAALEDLEDRVTEYVEPHASTHAPGGADAIDLTKIIPSGSSTPPLPDPLYPAGTLFFNTTDSRLRRSTGSAWQNVVAPPVSTFGTFTGTALARPAANTYWAGSVYVATDTGEVSRTDGTSTWTTLGYARPDAGVTASERPLYFDFTDTTTFARGWTAVAGTLWTPSGGVLPPGVTSEVVGVRASESVGDVEFVAKLRTQGTITAGATWGMVAKFIDVSNYLMLRWTPAGTLDIFKCDGGTFTALTTPVVPGASINTTYWFRGSVIGNTLTAERWSSDPAAGGSPTHTATYVLNGGDATKFGAGVRGKVGLRHNSVETTTLDDLIIRPLGRPPRQRDVQVFTSSGTWTKPAGAAADPKAVVEAHVVAGGSGGASGARRASGTATSGGAGGHSGAYTVVTALASQVSATSAVTVGAGGGGAAGITTNDTNGNNGSVGGVSSLSAFFTDGKLVQARTAGTTAAGGGSTGASGGGNGGAGTHTAGSAGSGVVGGAGGNGTMVTGNVTTAGGAGGGVSAAPAGQTGGSGAFGAIDSTASGTVAAGVVGATAPAGITVFPGGPTLGRGGGGGGGSHTGNGGNGAAGSNYGGGGGGGGSCLNGNTSGAGGAGAPGVVVVITEWGG